MCLSLLLPGGDFRQPPQMSFFLAELGRQERLHQIPGHGRPMVRRPDR